MVARMVRVHEAVGSNPATRTKNRHFRAKMAVFSYFSWKFRPKNLFLYLTTQIPQMVLWSGHRRGTPFHKECPSFVSCGADLSQQPYLCFLKLFQDRLLQSLCSIWASTVAHYNCFPQFGLPALLHPDQLSLDSLLSSPRLFHHGQFSTLVHMKKRFNL